MTPARLDSPSFPLPSPRAVLSGAAFGGLLAMLAACTDLAPVYTRPEPAVPRAGQPADSPADALAWRGFFSDDRLRDTVALALANNRDLRVAVLNVEKARAVFRQTDAARWPELLATAGSTRSQLGTTTTAQLALSSYEIDLFGRLKNLSASAQQAVLASDETRRSTQISLVAEVANAWLTLAADLARQQLAQQTLASQQHTLALMQHRHERGAATGLELAQARSAAESARVDAAAWPATLAQDRDALELLLGTALPDALAPRAGDAQAALSVLVDLPDGVPSEVLLRRPDVRAAEHQLIAAHADIGAARAALFPTITLTAAAGRSSNALSGLFQSGSGAWSYGPAVSLPLFDAGAARAALHQAEVAREVALASYERTVQGAFAEVADALAVRATLGERLTAQQALDDATVRQLELAEVQYHAGSTTMLDLLDAQRTLYAARQSLITLRLAEQGNRIALYKVLGGGWKNDDEPH